jgi:hypothetical protein
MKVLGDGFGHDRVREPLQLQNHPRQCFFGASGWNWTIAMSCLGLNRGGGSIAPGGMGKIGRCDDEDVTSSSATLDRTVMEEKRGGKGCQWLFLSWLCSQSFVMAKRQ